MSNYVVDYPWGEDKCVFKDFACVERLRFSFLDFDFVGRYNYVLAGQVFNLFDWFDEFQYVISTDPGFYCGEIKPFDDGYTLADHINTVYTDNKDAYAELTARKRDGSGEAVYTVNFKKSYERWRISSGTMLDLILRVDYG